MKLLPQEIIRKKRQGLALSNDDIELFFHGFLAGAVADYQVAAMLMAIVLRGMTPDETASLTKTMRDSGRVMSWGGPTDEIVDKHSTGGVGDKTSLIIMPLCILEGLRIPMIAGRGLGHTGGTLDKLASIPGMNVFVSTAKARKILNDLGGVFMGQTEEIAPLDRRLYAMRDVTDTVESIPLITASILSKKLAEGIGALVMDVKFGSGAFMVGKTEALALAESIAAVGRASGLQVRCALTDMGSPLGASAGNSLEVIECLKVMHGQGPDSTRNLSVDLTTELVMLARPKEQPELVRKRLHDHLASGRALEVFSRIIAAQGGDVTFIENPSRFRAATIQSPVLARESGVIQSCDVRGLGLAIIELGGGRLHTADEINPAVGLSELKRVGERVEKGQPIAIIHADDERSRDVAQNRVADAYFIGSSATPESLIWKVI